MDQARNAGFKLSAEQQTEFDARHAVGTGEAQSRIMSFAGESAEIQVKGVLTAAPDFLAWLFGGGNTTYGEIIAALAEADQNPNVKNITLAVDSPGGTIAGLFDTLAAIENTETPIKAVVSNMAASAAYALVSQADEIVLTNRAASVGSIGIVAGFRVDDSIIEITSTEAPDKRPDVTTPEGQAVVRAQLDDLHAIFVDAIANGRNTTVEKVNADFGRGGMLLADEALKQGMIDSVAVEKPRAVKSANSKTTARSGGDNQLEVGRMDLQTLRANHPDVFAAAVNEGVTKERDRVTAHLTLGKQAGAMDIATKAIEEGTDMTMTIGAQYNAAALNLQSKQAHAGDNVEAAAVVDGAATAATGDDAETAGDKILAKAAELCGVDVEA
jgi:ClpP class serine protease